MRNRDGRILRVGDLVRVENPEYGLDYVVIEFISTTFPQEALVTFPRWRWLTSEEIA